MRVLHVLHTSLPHVCGYSLRSDQILSIQRKDGIDVAVVTSAQQPDDPSDGVMEHVSYFRTRISRLFPSPIREIQLMWSLARRLSAVVKDVRPEIIHAHSPILVGLPAYFVARRHKLPFVYEIRDLWENASVDRGKFAAWSLPYRAARGLETWLLRRADAVVTIGETLRKELCQRANREVAVAPNGVDTESFKSIQPEPRWLQQWNSDDRQIIAYIGAFQPYEGLEILIKAMRHILPKSNRVHLLIVGDGPIRSDLEALVKSEDLGANVTFAGRLPHARVNEVYAVADLLVYPRIATLTTELTTPLKPLEALAMEKAVLASNLPAMRELISDQETGILFEPGNSTDLAEKALGLLADRSLRNRLGREGRTRALRDRRWETVVAVYQPVYRKLLEPSNRLR